MTKFVRACPYYLPKSGGPGTYKPTGGRNHQYYEVNKLLTYEMIGG
jgi:hypothetical protein